ncbi:hypothetical protein EON65_49105 [archaeon]|nr:MAG: hypothetical protein EON65_49105 [archaeon]
MYLLLKFPHEHFDADFVCVSAACDPFSKKKGKLPVDTKHDDPPELWEKKSESIFLIKPYQTKPLSNTFMLIGRKKQHRISKSESSIVDEDLMDDKVIEKLARQAEQVRCNNVIIVI